MIDLATRDQTHTQEALEGFEQLIKRFPGSKFLEDAKRKRKDCELKLALNIFDNASLMTHNGGYDHTSSAIRLMPQSQI